MWWYLERCWRIHSGLEGRGPLGLTRRPPGPGTGLALGSMSPQPPFFRPTTVARAGSGRMLSIVARAYERPGDNSIPSPPRLHRRVAALVDKGVTGPSLERWLRCPFRSQSRLCVPRSAHKSVPWLRPCYFCILSYHGPRAHVILGASCSSTSGLFLSSLAAILCFCNPRRLALDLPLLWISPILRVEQTRRAGLLLSPHSIPLVHSSTVPAQDCSSNN